MAQSYVLDEHLRGPLWSALRRHNAGGTNVVDVVRVGDSPDLPLGTKDPDLLLWAERAGRVLVTRDATTMPGHLADHLARGHHSPGVFLLRPGHTLAELAFALVFMAYTTDPADVRDQTRFIP